MTSLTIELPIAADIESLHLRIRACDRCVVDGFIERASPRVWGMAPAPFMVIGQAPSIREVGLGNQMYLGPAGLKLRSWLRDAGFSEDDFGKTVYMTAITKCFPGRLPGSSKDRAPSRAEQANCRPWLEQQLALVAPKLIVLFGKMAIDTFLGLNFPLDQCVGRAFDRGGILYLPLPHSSGASTWLNDPDHRQQVADALAILSTLRAAILKGEPISGDLLTIIPAVRSR